MTYLLPAPRIAGLLPARCPRIVTRVTPDSLTAAQEEVLQAALTHAEAAAEGCYAAAKYGPEWFAVSVLTRPECDGLVLYGYLRPHPDRKLKMWYALTDLGLERARALRLDLEAAANSPAPREASGCAVSPRRGEVGVARAAALRRLTRELAFQGFVILAEAGRGPHLGEQAFIHLFTRETRLYRCPLGTDRWEERRAGYYKADPSFARSQASLRAIPI